MPNDIATALFASTQSRSITPAESVSTTNSLVPADPLKSIVGAIGRDEGEVVAVSTNLQIRTALD